MTQTEEIMRAVAKLARQDGFSTFSRKQVRGRAGVDPARWLSSYNPALQGMRVDQPGGAIRPAVRFRDVFKRVTKGQYELTERGWAVVRELWAEAATVTTTPVQAAVASLPPKLDPQLVPSPEELSGACALYQQREQRDPMYRVASIWLQTYWGQADRIAEGLGVLLLTWNAAFYRYGYFDFSQLEACVERNLDLLDQLRQRDISGFGSDDERRTLLLFGEFASALCIASGKNKGRRSSIAVGKALHLLAPRFYPIWDRSIAGVCRCSSADHTGRSYVRFCYLTKEVAERLGPNLGETDRPLLKMIDEYYYVKFTKQWL